MNAARHNDLNEGDTITYHLQCKALDSIRRRRENLQNQSEFPEELVAFCVGMICMYVCNVFDCRFKKRSTLHKIGFVLNLKRVKIIRMISSLKHFFLSTAFAVNVRAGVTREVCDRLLCLQLTVRLLGCGVFGGEMCLLDLLLASYALGVCIHDSRVAAGGLYFFPECRSDCGNQIKFSASSAQFDDLILNVELSVTDENVPGTQKELDEWLFQCVKQQIRAVVNQEYFENGDCDERHGVFTFDDPDYSSCDLHGDCVWDIALEMVKRVESPLLMPRVFFSFIRREDISSSDYAKWVTVRGLPVEVAVRVNRNEGDGVIDISSSDEDDRNESHASSESDSEMNSDDGGERLGHVHHANMHDLYPRSCSDPSLCCGSSHDKDGITGFLLRGEMHLVVMNVVLAFTSTNARRPIRRELLQLPDKRFVSLSHLAAFQLGVTKCALGCLNVYLIFSCLSWPAVRGAFGTFKQWFMSQFVAAMRRCAGHSKRQSNSVT